MPQMSPMNWLNLMLLFISILYIILNNIYYMINLNPLTNNKKNTKIKMLTKNNMIMKIKW